MTCITLRWAALGLAVAALAACSTAPTKPTPPSTPATVGESRPGSGYLKGYLAPQDMPDSLQLVGAPPAAGSPAFALDEEVHRQMKALRAGPRGVLAMQDAELRFPAAAETFVCTLGIAISQEETPLLNKLLRRSLIDAG
ncbi:MAG: acid phosphatase, partial [Rhizobacter sp.]